MKNFNYILSLPAESLLEDLENLLLREIGRMRGMSVEEVNEYTSKSEVAIQCLLIYLVNVAKVDTTLPIILELLRLPSETLYSVIGNDADDNFVLPVLYVLTKNNPSLLKPFLLEESTSHFGKQIVIYLLAKIYLFNKDRCVDKEFNDTIHELMDAYLKDYNKDQKICDKDIISYIVNTISDAGMSDMYDTVVELYNKDIINEDICGDLDNALYGVEHGSSSDEMEIETDPKKLMYGMPKNWDYFFTEDGSQSHAQVAHEIGKELDYYKK